MTSLNDFLDGPKTIGGLNFRPFTFGSKALCSQLKLSIFISGETPTDDGEAERQINTFTWIHSAPLPDVLKAVREGRAEEAALEFSFGLPLAAMTDVVAEINRISRQAADNAVEIDEKPGIKSDTPGNSVGQGN